MNQPLFDVIKALHVQAMQGDPSRSPPHMPYTDAIAYQEGRADALLQVLDLLESDAKSRNTADKS